MYDWVTCVDMSYKLGPYPVLKVQCMTGNKLDLGDYVYVSSVKFRELLH